jgi:hypothetical protein
VGCGLDPELLTYGSGLTAISTVEVGNPAKGDVGVLAEPELLALLQIRVAYTYSCLALGLASGMSSMLLTNSSSMFFVT